MNSYEFMGGCQAGFVDGRSTFVQILHNFVLEGVISKSGQFVCSADDMDIAERTLGTVAKLYLPTSAWKARSAGHSLILILDSFGRYMISDEVLLNANMLDSFEFRITGESYTNFADSGLIQILAFYIL